MSFVQAVFFQPDVTGTGRSSYSPAILETAPGILPVIKPLTIDVISRYPDSVKYPDPVYGSLKKQLWHNLKIYNYYIFSDINIQRIKKNFDAEWMERIPKDLNCRKTKQKI